MTVQQSAVLGSEFTKIALLARETGEPIFITETEEGEPDGVYMSISAYEEREKMLAHRASILAAEAQRLAGAPMLTPEQLRERLKEKFSHA